MNAVGRRAAVVGGGPAGLMAAEVLAEAGVDVTVFELHRSPGRKLLLAGRSGLNITHTEPFADLRDRYRPLAPALAAALDGFPPAALQQWVEDLGQPTFVGSSGRLFPEAQRAAPLLRAWLARLDGLGVEMRTGHEFTGWSDDGAVQFRTTDGDVEFPADAMVLALGGASWPRVGSPAGWVEPLEAQGVGIAPLRAANCGVHVDWSPVFRDRFEGSPIKNVVVSFDSRSVRGELMITGRGLEGTPVYSLASSIGADNRFPTTIELDLAPDLDGAGLAARLARRRPKESQSTWLRRVGLAPIAIGLLREATGNRLPDDPAEMASLIATAPVVVTALAPLDRAISTAGGVEFAGLDERLMIRSQPGVFLAGEMLDWDAPTGGYLLQACFSTGRFAGESAVGFLDR